MCKLLIGVTILYAYNVEGVPLLPDMHTFCEGKNTG